MAKGCSSNNYEEARKQRLEENKKRFEDLGISKISKNLAKVASPAKKSPNRLPKPKSKTNDVLEPRRSSRARNQVTSYQEEFSIDLPHQGRYLRKRSRSSSSSWESYVARPLDEIKEATKQERICALEAAEALQISLKSSNPYFIKSMVRSHVYSCFWLGLPSRFCEKHLPKTVYNMVLEDENGSEYDAVYIGSRSGLSGGWRGFALEHKLDDGDALIFELVEPARFKIYIVKAFPDIDGEEENDTLVGEENIHTSKESKDARNRKSESKKTKKKKQAIACETKESESSEENLSESSIDKDTKPQRVNSNKKAPDSELKGEAKIETLKPKADIRQTRSSQKKMQNITEVPTPTTPEPQVETVKSNAAVRKTRSSQGKMQKISEVPTTLEPKEEAKVETVKPKAATKLSNRTRKSKEGNACEIGDTGNTEKLLLEDNAVKTTEANPGKKEELVQDVDIKLKKVEPDEKASKPASQVPRKKPAPKFFRKRA